MSDPVGCQCPVCLPRTSAATGRSLSRAVGRWFEAIGRCYMYAEGMLPDDDGRNLWDGRALDPGEVYIVNGVNQIEHFLSERPSRRGRRGAGGQWQ